MLGIGAVTLEACGGGGDSGQLAAATLPSASPATGVSAATTAALSWVPSQGGTSAVVVPANTFASQNGNLPGWEFAFRKIVDDFSGGVFNPYWGALGAMVFHGGGHAATFDNSVVIFDYNDLTFKRLSDPTPSNNGANWNAIYRTSTVKTDPAFNGTYCEYGDGQPGSAHTYDSLAILPPADGGAPYGSLIRVSSHAVHVNLSGNTGWSHRFDFLSTDMRQGKWTRWSVNGIQSYLFPGACSAYDSKRKRFWWMAGLSSSPPAINFLDAATRQQLQARYALHAPIAPAAAPDSMTLRYEPVRDILVLTCVVAGKLVLAFLQCAAPELGWFVPPLSAAIPVASASAQPFDLVPELDKFVLLSDADSAAVYELSPPQDPKQTWTVVRRPIVGVPLQAAHVTGKRWSYASAVKAFVWMAKSSSDLIAYRPFGV